MVLFPETAETEWNLVADAANAKEELRARIQRANAVAGELEKMRVRHEAKVLHENELSAGETPALEMGTLAIHKNSPAAVRQDLIEGVLKDNSLCIMIGPSESGKSTTALQMLYSLSTGNDFLGQKVMKLDGAMGVLSYDMDAAQVYNWMGGFPGIDPAKFAVVNAYKRGNPLAVPLMRAQIAAAWRAMNMEVVVLDSFSASFFGLDQNDAAATMAHYRDMLKFALTECGARALVVIAHSTPSSPDKIRGSTVHHDVADSIMGQVKDDTTQVRTLRNIKYRADIGQHPMNPVMLSAPDTVTHLVDLDINQMNLAGMQIPARAAVNVAFPPLPDKTADADTDSDSGDEDNV